MRKKTEPMLTINKNSEFELELMKNAIGKDAIDKAFGAEGGGIKEIEDNCRQAQQDRLAKKLFGE